MKEHDLVVLTRAIPEHELEPDDVGTIVHRNEMGTDFEVEFMSAEARTIAVLTRSADDLRSMDRNENLHARRLTPAHN